MNRRRAEIPRARPAEVITEDRTLTFVPLAFEPREAFQLDWSDDWPIIGNERTKLQVAHTKLSYSRDISFVAHQPCR